MQRSTMVIVTFSIILIVVSVTLLMIYPTSRNKTSEQPADLGGSFILTDHNGQVFNSRAIRGKLKLIYFGFINCPDVCPSALNTIIQLLQTLGDDAQNLQPIFITIDPERDTVTNLKDYIEYFDKNIIGLTGTPNQIKVVADLYKVYYAKSDFKTQHYMMNHSSFFYLTDQNDRYITHFSYNANIDDMAERIKRYF